MEKTADFTEGRILSRLLRFALPVLAALFLQAMYGAVDLMVVGQFGAPTDVSAVSTGSQIMQTVTSLITGLAMGITILVGQKIGEKRPEQAGDVIGSGICLFGVLAAVLTVLMILGAGFLAGLCMRRMRPFPRPWIISGSAPPGPCSSSPTMSWAAFFAA